MALNKARIAVYRSTSNSPFVNLAVENWLMNRQNEEEKNIMYLWRNGPSVIIGRFQNAWKECNVQKMNDEKVNLVRRSTGGGAVYQDLGNSIFSFISPKEENSTPGIDRNNSIIIDALSTFDINAVASGRNDMHVDDLKISGAAFKHTKDRSLHHGTVLLDVDMQALGGYLTPNKAKLESKGISSVQARVLNLKTRVPSMTHESLSAALTQSFFKSHSSSCDIIDIDESIVEREPLVKEVVDQLQDWDWRFGKEPPFTHHVEHRFDWGSFDLHLTVKKGLIEGITVYSDALDVYFVEALKTCLTGVVYSPESVVLALDPRNMAERYGGANVVHTKEFAEWLAKEMM